jgi:hypothetical protein
MNRPEEKDQLFDFVTDEAFRAGLVSDYREMLNGLKSGSWKSVHVLAGSIIEAVLADYLMAEGHTTINGKDILKAELGPIITAARAEGILSERAESLSKVVKDYRNLIHAGRVVRLDEKADADGANGRVRACRGAMQSMNRLAQRDLRPSFVARAGATLVTFL